jgi:hypothetical protein
MVVLPRARFFVLHKPRALSIDWRHNLGKPSSQCVNVEIKAVESWMRVEDKTVEYANGVLNSLKGAINLKR